MMVASKLHSGYSIHALESRVGITDKKGIIRIPEFIEFIIRIL